MVEHLLFARGIVICHETASTGATASSEVFACQWIADDGATSNRPAAARQLVPSRTAAGSREPGGSHW
jgi:hypothetical protein